MDDFERALAYANTAPASILLRYFQRPVPYFRTAYGHALLGRLRQETGQFCSRPPLDRCGTGDFSGAGLCGHSRTGTASSSWSVCSGPRQWRWPLWLATAGVCRRHRRGPAPNAPRRAAGLRRPSAPGRQYDNDARAVDETRSAPVGSQVAGRGGQRAQQEAAQKEAAERDPPGPRNAPSANWPNAKPPTPIARCRHRPARRPAPATTTTAAAPPFHRRLRS